MKKLRHCHPMYTMTNSKQRCTPMRMRWKFWLLASARCPHHYCQCDVPYSPLSQNVTLSTKTEVQNILHCCQRRTEPQPQLTCSVQKVLWRLEMQFLRYASEPTYTHAHHNTLHPYQEQSKQNGASTPVNNWGILFEQCFTAHTTATTPQPF